MNKSPNDRGSRKTEVLCLCPICAADFYLSGKYTIRKADEMQVVKTSAPIVRYAGAWIIS